MTICQRRETGWAHRCCMKTVVLLPPSSRHRTRADRCNVLRTASFFRTLVYTSPVAHPRHPETLVCGNPTYFKAINSASGPVRLPSQAAKTLFFNSLLVSKISGMVSDTGVWSVVTKAVKLAGDAGLRIGQDEQKRAIRGVQATPF